jgi:hypothetical protein
MDLKFLENDILCQILNINLMKNIFKNLKHFFEDLKKLFQNDSKNVFQKIVTKTVIKEVDVVHVILFAP